MKTLLGLLTVLGVAATGVVAQPQKITVPLKLDVNRLSVVSRGLPIKPRGPLEEGTVTTIRESGGRLVVIHCLDEDERRFRVGIDLDGEEGVFGDSEFFELSPERSVTVFITRRGVPLPYVIKYRFVECKGQPSRDWFGITPRYRAEGTFSVGGKSRMIVLQDLDANGVFDRRDFSRGTSVAIDRNGDGKIRGRDEHLYGDQIIRFGGGSYEIESVKADGSSVTLVPSKLPVAEIDRPMPAVTLRTAGGEAIDCRKPARALILYLWATW